MSANDNDSVFLDSSMDDDFSFGMGVSQCPDNFDSDSDGKADNVVVEMDLHESDELNQQLLDEMKQLTVHDDELDAWKEFTNGKAENKTAVCEDNHMSISSEESADAQKKRKGSVITQLVTNGDAVFISLDLEHGGNKCGVTQLLAVLFRLGGFESSDMQKDVVIREVFNEYIRPPQNANWNPICQEVTGLHPKHPCIMNADPIEVVWQRFVQFINTHRLEGESHPCCLEWCIV